MHVRFNSWYISLPSSAKQRREMTKLCGVYETWTTPGNFSYFHLELNAVDRCICSCNTFLEPLAYRTNQDNREFRLQNINSFFFYASSSASSSSLLKLPKDGHKTYNASRRTSLCVLNDALQRLHMLELIIGYSLSRTLRLSSTLHLILTLLTLPSSAP